MEEEKMNKAGVLVVIVCVIATVNFASADIIRGINIDFVTIGNAGNGTDPATGNLYGAVSYVYRIGKYEVTNTQWNAFTAAAGAPTGNDGGWNENEVWEGAYKLSAQYTGAQQPTNNASWYEAAQFCNYLTSGDKSKGAYQFSGDNNNPGYFQGINRTAAQTTYGITYVLPTEDEWYKAAYFKPDASGYSLYANGLNTIPAADDGWNYIGGSYFEPWSVGTGTQEQNGTFDMMGNVWELLEPISDDSCRIRGSSFYDPFYPAPPPIWTDVWLTSPYCAAAYPSYEDNDDGFRVASVVPEPASAAIMTLASLFIALKRRKR